ncbi:MAG: hypothetical protein JXA20_14230 [Spirochaetes bacterium]|nr:hypothetical protein [Spirochaetota bacterium]
MEKKPAYDRIKYFLLPVYDEVTLFLHGMIGLLYLLFNIRPLASDFVRNLSLLGGGEIVRDCLLALAVLSVVCLPIYHAFAKRKKWGWEKMLMVGVITVMNFIVAWNVFDYVKGVGTAWDLVIPLINALQSSFFLLLPRKSRIAWGSVSEENAPLGEVVTSGILVVMIFVLYRTVLKTHWSIVISSCIFYAATVNRLVFIAVRSLKGRRA